MQPERQPICDRCAGFDIDPIRVGLWDEVPCDPEWCADCGGSGIAARYPGPDGDHE